MGIIQEYRERKALQKLVKTIDPELKYVKTLQTGGADVFLVGRGMQIGILKNDLCQEHITSERKGLVRAVGVPGITHLVKDYGHQESYNAILKEYFEGESHRRISDTSQQKKLEQTVKDLHSLGITKLDIDPRNIVLSPDEEEAKIIDFGGCYFKENYSSVEFRKFKLWDLSDLEDCFC